MKRGMEGQERGLRKGHEYIVAQKLSIWSYLWVRSFFFSAGVDSGVICSAADIIKSQLAKGRGKGCGDDSRGERVEGGMKYFYLFWQLHCYYGIWTDAGTKSTEGFFFLISGKESIENRESVISVSDSLQTGKEGC